MATDKFTLAPWRTRPIFISSTFKDMHAERDYLRHIIFPRLQEELRKGRLLLEPIDLRQGLETVDLKSEEKRELLVLKVCLQEIQRSRPFLIVLVGDRYGWVPPEDRIAAATQEVDWTATVRDKSVTALEIDFGILKPDSKEKDTDQRRRCFFYFRDPLPYSAMPENVRATYSDEFSTDPQTRARHSRLAALKQSLVNDPELAPRVHNYHAEWDASKNEVTGLEVWGEQVYQHLLGELQVEIAAATNQPQSRKDQERAALAEFIEHRRRDFAGRQQLLDEMTNLALSKTPPGALFSAASGVSWGACLTGVPGSGKSAIFAELVARLASHTKPHRQPVSENQNWFARVFSRRKLQTNLESTESQAILLLTNAASATPCGSRVEMMLERFIEELSDALGIANPLSENATPDDVDAIFSGLLVRAAMTRRVVLLLDAINQFDAVPRAERFTWLRPKQWPANARLLATGLAGVATETLTQWAGIEKRTVPPLTISDDHTDDVTEIAKAIWRRYHRQAIPAVLKVLKEKRLPDGSFAAENPLWLTLTLEQINLLDADDFARAERDFSDRPAHERVTAMLIDTARRMPPSVPELYELLLVQTERLFGIAHTRAFAAVIAVSRFGWRERDLLKLIPAAAHVLCPSELIPKLDELQLASIRRGFRAHVARHGQLQQLDFCHLQMRQAVEQRALRDRQQTTMLHRTIATFLSTLPSEDPLREAELMAHLIAGNDPAQAARVYADLTSPAGAPCPATEALAQFVMVGANCHPNGNATWVTTLLSQPGLTHQQVANIGRRFNFVLKKALADTTDLATRQSLIQAALSAQQRLIKFAPANAQWQFDLSVSFIQLGELAMAQGELSKAQEMFEESLSIRKKLAESDPANAELQNILSVPLLDLGELARTQGNLSEAQRLYGDALLIARRLAESNPANADWLRDLSMACNRLGDLAIEQGNLPEAEKMFVEAFQIAELLAWSNPTDAACQRDLSLAFQNFGKLMTVWRNVPEAERLYNKSLRISQRLTESHPANAQFQRDMSVAFDCLGRLAMAQGKLSEAQRLFSEAFGITRRLAESDPVNVEWQSLLWVTSQSIAKLMEIQGNLPEAQRLSAQALGIARRRAELDPANANWQSDLSESLIRLGEVAKAQGNLPEAQRLFSEAFGIERQLADSNPANAQWEWLVLVSLNRLGDLAKAQGKLLEAQRLYDTANPISRRLTNFRPAKH